MDAGLGYRLLEEGEKVQEGDDCTMNGKWAPSIAWMPGNSCGGSQIPTSMPYRRKLPSTHPPLSQEAKDSMDQFHEDALGMLDRVVAVPQVPADSQTFLSHDERDYISRELGSLMQSIVRGTRTKEELFRYLTKLAEICGINPDLKPFTPNKYTRWMPTLDGRKVPVDVYCVLAAFPTGSSAVDHAVKKQLAPGQRGHKDRIQDLKEARDSLTRAIELEEAANAP